MKILFAAMLLALSGAVLAAGDSQKSPLYWTYEYVIATSDEELSVAQLVFDLPHEHPEMCDRDMHKGGRRYARVLETVSTGAVDEKLRRWAALKVEPGLYVPGSTRLAELASVYPVPYPVLAGPRTR
jgi:hypothetical protein